MPAQHARTLDRGLEGGQVQFTQRAIADRLVHVQAVGLLAVRGEMLGAGRHVGFLHALDVADGLLGGGFAGCRRCAWRRGCDLAKS